MTREVSTKEVSERTSQQWGPLDHTCLTFKDQDPEKLRQLYMASSMAIGILEGIRDSLRELEQSLGDTE